MNMNFYIKLRAFFFGVKLTHFPLTSTDKWNFECGNDEFVRIIFNPDTSKLLMFKHGVNYLQEYKLHVSTHNWFWKKKFTLRKIRTEYTWTYYKPGNKKWRGIVLCTETMKDIFGFVPNKLYYNIKLANQTNS